MAHCSTRQRSAAGVERRKSSASAPDLDGRTPFEIHEMHAHPDGFDLTFTEPLDRATAEVPLLQHRDLYLYLSALTTAVEVDKKPLP